ncbi:uncharacterized protein DNG_02361 [Cephalotrichum gorgonifer]|uniref:Uncharacterized protein n=1 Tax=Cephalotrichum gorgonifer TaxID=2041049 RepID=A0AAE8MUN6_9PEZI|nr:uncharacterized protein DNG_02361 [Cephalotrichum gorgonifer]
MKTTLVAAALMGSATAHISAHLARRDGSLSGIDPDVLSSLPEECRTVVESVVSAMPAEPTIFSAFSSGYYETNSRTATATDEDCAWITELPAPAKTAYVEYAVQIRNWLVDLDNVDLIMDVQAECGELQPNDNVACMDEWSDFAIEAAQAVSPDILTAIDSSLTSVPTPASTSASASETPETTESSESTGTEGPEPTGTSDEGNAASAMGAQTYAVASILAAFVGAIALI